MQCLNRIEERASGGLTDVQSMPDYNEIISQAQITAQRLAAIKLAEEGRPVDDNLAQTYFEKEYENLLRLGFNNLKYTGGNSDIPDRKEQDKPSFKISNVFGLLD